MGSAGDIAVRVSGLRKSYGALEALAGVDIEIRRGEVFGLLGPNGAGKTTLVEILEGHRKRDAGEASVLGFDPDGGERALREKIGIVLQEEGVDGVLTVREAVEIYSAPYPRPRDPMSASTSLGSARRRTPVWRRSRVGSGGGSTWRWASRAIRS
jgi:ABC-type multidrug transport system ATPase subunit